MVVLIAVLMLTGWPLAGADYYVAPGGSDENPGTAVAPWSLTKICRPARSGTPMSAVSPGDTVWLRGGTYPVTQQLYCEHSGTSGAPIIFRAYPGERPLIAAQPPGWSGSILSVSGSYVAYIGIHITYEGTLLQNSNLAPDNQVPGGWNVSVQLLPNPQEAEISNSFSWRTRGFISATSSDHRTLYHGNVVFSQVVADIDRNHGGACYAQNDEANGWEEHDGNVFVLNPGHYNCRGYATAGTVKAIRQTRNITLGGNNSWFRLNAGDQGPYEFTGNTWVLNTHSLMIQNLTAASITGNVIASLAPLNLSLRLRLFSEANVTDNFLHGYPSALNAWERNDGGTLTVGGNIYHTATPPAANASARVCSSTPDYAGRPHQTSGYPTYWPLLGPPHPEPASVCNDGMPSENVVRVYPNLRETGRAHVAVLNYEGLASTAVDLAGVLRFGDRYEIVDLWDPLGAPVATGIYSAGPVQIPLTGTAVYDPLVAQTCWQVDRASCLTGGEYPVAASAGELPDGAYVGQRAMVSDFTMFRWTGSSWASQGAVNTVAWPVFQRIPGAHAFLIRRLYDGRAETTLSWRGAETDVIEAGYRVPDGSITWGELPVTGLACATGRCRARVPQAVGDAWWRINGGPALKMTARNGNTLPVVRESPWSADYSSDFGVGGL